MLLEWNLSECRGLPVSIFLSSEVYFSYEFSLLISAISFPLKEVPFNTYSKAGLVLMNAFSFCLSGKLYLFYSVLSLKIFFF